YRWLPIGGARAIRVDGESLAPGQVRFLGTERHRVAFDADGTRGLLVLAIGEPPGPAPAAFYQAYSGARRTAHEHPHPVPPARLPRSRRDGGLAAARDVVRRR